MKRSELFFAFITVPVDIAMIIASFVMAYLLRRHLEVVGTFSQVGIKEYLSFSMYLIPIWIFLFTVNGLYKIKTSRNFLSDTYKIFSASSVAILFLVVGLFFGHTLFFSRLILIFIWIMSIFAISVGRLVIQAIQKYLLRYAIGQRRVVLVGDNGTSFNVANFIAEHASSGFKVCGVLNGESTASKFGLKILGQTKDLESIVKKYKIDEAIVTDTAITKSKLMDIVRMCSDRNIILKFIPDTFSLMTRNVTPGLLGSMPVMELDPIPLDGWGRILKRVADFCFALFLLTILSPLYLLVILLQILTSRGPVFYWHDRIGRDGKKFKCYKFRSMYADKCDFSKGGSKWTTANDEKTRVTPLGRILRKTNLDEIPQFWNILIGDMSFVGPRPEQPKLVQKFESEIPEYFRRHRVKAGLTGWAQVNGLKGDTSIKERVRYDIFYIENWSLWFDLKIIIKTIGLIINEAFRGKSEYSSRS